MFRAAIYSLRRQLRCGAHENPRSFLGNVRTVAEGEELGAARPYYRRFTISFLARTEVVRKESNMKSFLVVPFEFDPAGKVEYGEARRVSSELGARCLAAAMVATSPGALVLSKTDSEPPEVAIVASYGIGADEPALAASETLVAYCVPRGQRRCGTSAAVSRRQRRASA